MSGLSLQTKPRETHGSALAESIRRGDIRALSRLISLLEAGEPAGPITLASLERRAPAARRARVIGITGYPGSGKSTLISRLAAAYRRRGHRVGILAVDTSSPVTGGAILGDRIRMQDHTLDEGIFIRSMATRGQHGGLARATPAAVRALEAAGYEVILIETIGVGQAEVDVASVAQTVVAIVAPGLGDEVQAMKAGLFEVAHILVVNKSDREGAETTWRDLRAWLPRVLRTVATTGHGVSDLLAAIEEHQATVSG
jgi:LAO/AO transport system kinase